jgi:hypothetical protein
MPHDKVYWQRSPRSPLLRVDRPASASAKGKT